MTSMGAECQLLPSNLSLKYVAEGAANVIWRISPSLPGQFTSTPTELKPGPVDDIKDGYAHTRNSGTEVCNSSGSANLELDYRTALLRLRKCLPSSEENCLAFKYLSSVIMPLFPSGILIKQTLVQLPPGLVSRGNDILHHLEDTDTRPIRRRGLYLAGDPRPGKQRVLEPFAFLVEDMSPDVSKGEFLLEFKAKWLVQSPNAPSDWTRCRTCALRLMKSSRVEHRGKPMRWKGLCPLDLVSLDPNRRRTAVSQILGYPRQTNSVIVERVAEALANGPQLEILKNLQATFDPLGILKADHRSQNFLTAMTLRDCTFYVKVGKSTIQARLGDFDVKSAEGGKSRYWEQTENELIRDGWYTGRESGDFPWKSPGAEVCCRESTL